MRRRGSNAGTAGAGAGSTSFSKGLGFSEFSFTLAFGGVEHFPAATVRKMLSPAFEN